MPLQSTNRNHELDLDLILEYGFPQNSEDELLKKEFVTEESIKVVNEITSLLFADFDREFLRKKSQTS